LPAKLVGRSHQHDLALLDVEANAIPIVGFARGQSQQGTVLASIEIESTPLSTGFLGHGNVEVPSCKGQLGFKVERNPEGDGVRVSDVLYALSRAVLNERDIITHFDGQVVRN